MGLILSLDPLSSLPKAEDAGKLSDCEDALTIEFPQFLLAHPPQEREVILLDSLVMASAAELADLAVIVQYQARWRSQSCHRHQFLPETLTASRV
jgi:hypothetical protein